jgi:drug/metabolite transporter (DMT)-like permease
LQGLNRNVIHTWILLIVLAFIWGSSFILMKRAMYGPDGEIYLSSTRVAALRMVVASIVMLPFILKGLKPNYRKFKWPLAAVGFFGNGIPAFLFTTAQTKLDSGITGILNSLTPLFTLIVAMVVFGRRYLLLNYLGILVALIGAILLITGHRSSMSGAPAWAYALVVLATMMYAISVNVIRNMLADLSPIHITGLALLWVSPFCLGFLIYDGFFQELAINPMLMKGLPFALILAVFGTSISLILFNQLIKMSNALFASSVTYLMPIMAIIWGYIDGELIALSDIALAGVIISGIYLVNLKAIKTK